MTQKQLIEKYPKIFQEYEGNPIGVNWDVPDVWIPVIDDLCGAIQKHVDTFSRWSKEKEDWVSPQQVTCVQMKEKFGGLRFYVAGADDHIDGMIDMAEHICYNMCQSCGTREGLGVKDGWITVCCFSCYDSGKFGIGEWKPLNKNV